METFEQIALNFAPSFSRRTLQGRQYLVVPLSLIVPGVLNGSKGRLLYNPEDVGRDPSVWNHVPIVVYHPSDSRGNISARDPGVLEKQAVGYVFNAYFNGKLRAEGWFDEERTREVDIRVYDAIVNRRSMELSTGLYTDDYPAPEGAVYNGKPYDFIARNYRPDHLAILPDEKGACSLADGCGVNVVNQSSEPESNNWIMAKFFDAVALLTNAIGQRSKVTGRIKTPNAGTGAGPVHEAAQAGAVVLNDRDRELGAKAEASDDTPDWCEDGAKWEKAKNEASKGYKDSPDYWAVTAHIYRKLGGRVTTPSEVETSPTIEATENRSGGVPQSDSLQQGKDQTMPLSQSERKGLIDKLVANKDSCGCKSVWKESDRETLNAFTDDRLKALVENAEAAQANMIIVNRVKKGVKLGDQVVKFDSDEDKFVVNAFPFKKDEEEDPEDAEEGEEAENKAAAAKKNKVKNCGAEDDEEETMNRGKKAPAANRVKDYLDNAPPEVREVIANAVRNQKAERAGLISKIVANCADPDRKKRLPVSLAKLDLDTLRDLAANAKPTTNGGEGSELDQIASYLGANPTAAPVGNEISDDESEILLPSIVNYHRTLQRA